MAFLPGLLAMPAVAAESSPSETDATLSRGFDFLSAHQNRDGSFGAAQRPAITSLALLAFLSSGHTPNGSNLDPPLGKYGAIVRGAVDYLLTQAQPDGSFARQDKPMYGQAIATLALAEEYGVDVNEPRRRRIFAALNNSVRLIVAAQDVHKPDAYAGGWRYEVNSPDSDLSVTGWNLLALRACQDVGINVPKTAFARAMKFVARCFNPAGRGFAYQPGDPAHPGATGMGLLCMRLLDGSQTPQAIAAAATLSKKPADDDATYPYSAMFYAVAGAYVTGDDTWAVVQKDLYEKLSEVQQSDGGWPEGGAEANGAGRSYTTSMALFSLGLQCRMLPVLEH